MVSAYNTRQQHQLGRGHRAADWEALSSSNNTCSGSHESMKSGLPYVSSGRLTSIVTPSSSFITECSQSSHMTSSCVCVCMHGNERAVNKPKRSVETWMHPVHAMLLARRGRPRLPEVARPLCGMQVATTGSPPAPHQQWRARWHLQHLQHLQQLPRQPPPLPCPAQPAG